MTTTGAGLPEWDPALRDRVRRLMRVLRAIAAARTRPTRHTDSCYGVQWLGKAAEHLTVQPATEPGHEVLRAPRVVSETAPELPAELKGWVEYRPKQLVEPTLKDHGPARYGDVVGLDERPEQRDRFGRWLRTWSTWAEAERVRRARGAVHDELFRLYRVAEDRPESVEIVLSAGLLHLPDTDTGGVHVHVVNQPVDLHREVATGDMVVTVTEAPARLEDDEILGDDSSLFDGSGGPRLRERLDELVSGAMDPELPTFLKEWRDRALKVACELSDAWEEPTSRRPELRLAPALVARPRSGFALRNYFDTIIANLADERQPVPLGLAQLVEPLESDLRLNWLERSGKLAGRELAADPLFPLPANPAQRQIIDRMGADSGVVVEGPPGTGKTHTIANLVSSLLAQGQRVLVTSEKAQALKVLRDKLPAEMQDLCISMTDASSKGDSDLARSVTRISTRKTSFDASRAERRVRDLSGRRLRLQGQRERLLNEIQALREAETIVHPEVAPGFTGTTAAIARALVATVDDDWVADDVPSEAPLTVDELYELVDLLRREGPERRSRRDQVLPALESLPSPQRLGRLSELLERGDRAVSGEDGPLVAEIEDLPDQALHALGPASQRAADALTELSRVPRDPRWAHATAEEQLRGQRTHAWARATDQLALVDEAIAADSAVQNADVQVDPSAAPAPDAASLDAYADDMDANGPSFWPWMKSPEQKKVESYKGRLTVNGAPVDGAATARLAARHLQVVEIAAALHRAFEPLGASLRPSSHRIDLVDEMATLARTCRAIGAVLAGRDELAALFSSLPAARRPRLDGLASIHRLTGVALAVGHAHQARLARHEIDETGAQLGTAGGRSPEHEELMSAWREVDPARFARGLDALARARRQQAEQARCDALLDRLRGAAPRVASDLAGDAHSTRWDARTARFPQAWARARATAWLARHRSPGRERELEQELQVATYDLEQGTAALAAESAWKACLEGMSTREMQALQIYRQQVASVGKGTGKFAEKFRQGARAAMAEAQHAVPAWIMPIQQVLASVPPEKDVFDVVIVDEASQAELTSAFLLWLAPRMIVVGDDKQCTPAEVMQGALAPIFDRLDNELPDLPPHRRMQFTSKSSVFSLLRSCFPQVIRLQEHFRCMPEIIEWSSSEFYADAPLVPLRQFGADRLPPLRATYVPHANQQSTGQKIANLREAHTIADLVAQSADDPAYAGRTFGVVVLQGHGQVQLIEDVLRARLGDEQWEKRRLRVGTPPDFQGDERNVVWLSMVLAPDHRSMALTNEMYRQRFNVAASRAQDQLWLVHSMPADRLGAADMRRLLLEYMTDVDESAVAAMPEGIGRHERAPGFDSLLEQNVFCDLAERGHHVTPQFEINGRRLDLVVTGPGGRIAVECDADTVVLSDEERRAELDREQELKRAGWRFSRVPASAYVLDAPTAVARLDEDLTRAGITPLLADGVGAIPTRIVDEAPQEGADEDDEPPVDEPSAPVPAPRANPVTPTPDSTPPRTEGRRVEPGDREDPWYSTARAAGSRGPQAVANVATETPRAPTPPPADIVIDGLGTNEVRDLVVRIVSDRGIVSASDLAAMIGVPKMEARGLLTDLSVAGRLAKTGGRDNPLFAPPDPEPPTSPPTRTEVPGGPARSRLRTTPRPRGGPPPPPPDFVQSEASRRQQIRKIADEMQRLGAVEPAFDAELIDDDPERGGAILCIAELFWADGVRGDGGKKVVLELDPEEADLDRLRELKFRVFTTIAELRTIMTAEFQGSHRAGGSR